MSPATCVPVKELKNTAEFTQIVQSAPGPVIVTKNGHESFVSMSMDCYRQLCAESARSCLYRAIDRAEEDVRTGRVVDAHQAGASLRARYGL